MPEWVQMDGDGVEIVEHTADWALQVRGADLGRLFHNAALGMAQLLFADYGHLPCSIERELILAAYDVESLLVDWLGELAYWAETEQLVVCAVHLTRISTTQLAATVTCAEAPSLDKHIKAVTYHNLAITNTPDGLETTVVFDV